MLPDPPAPDYLYFGQRLGKSLGRGWDGEVFELDDERVVKFSRQPLNTELLGRIKKDKPSHFAIVYRFGKFGEPGLPLGRFQLQHPNLLSSWVSFVEMERLEELTKDEVKVFHSLVSHEDANRTKVFTPERLNEILDGLARGLEFDRQRAEALYWSAMSSEIAHGDMHPKNLLKTKDGQFKFVDLDRLYLRTTKETTNDRT